MSGKSQELIQQLLVAEKQAEELIATAKKNRLTKLRQAKEAADEELAEFRQKEEEKFAKEFGAKANVDPAADLKTTTQMEINMVQRDYDTNKAKTVQYIVGKVLDVQIGLSETQKQALKTGMC
eukprot:gnl/TRDRNA2_/TRDRNA2_85315_c0_seq1.p1 gnl/TRDRNA2_/TRDRNA2_85315_c0~~gnl/TRDRNA2_/TRDRNA2_85315_c0_seq1.p1  ORF type:complete len:123 (+),score=56.12 gnl/TRDRNA2_/TRDRNA2_85315_c0_seq1:79-447(+)